MKTALTNNTQMALAPIAVANGSATSLAVDATRAYGVTFEFSVGVSTGNFTVAKIQSSTASGGSYEDVTGAALDSGTITTTSAGKIYAIHIDLRDRTIGEYFKIVLTEDNTGSSIVGVNARLWDLEEGATTATARGYAAEVFA